MDIAAKFVILAMFEGVALAALQRSNADLLAGLVPQFGGGGPHD
jgi:hypothetical protein